MQIVKRFFKFKLIIHIISIGFILQLYSCSSYKKIPYFKDVSDSIVMYHQGIDIRDTNKVDVVKIKSKDILQIKIYTSDGNISNIGSAISKSYGKLDIGSSITGVDPFNGNNDYNYIVSSTGEIAIPSIGSISVAGLTIEQAQKEIYKKVSIYLNEPVVSVKMANFKITVLGEVNKSGTYIIEGDNINIIEALGMAGDMTVFGKRENVLLLHPTDDHNTKLIRFDLNSKSTLQSPYYHLQQNDVIYVEPNKGKAAANDASQIRTYAIISTVASIVLALIYSLRK